MAQHCVLGMLHPRVSSIGCLPLNSVVYNCYCSENMVYGQHLVISLATIAIHEACHSSLQTHLDVKLVGLQRWSVLLGIVFSVNSKHCFKYIFLLSY